MGLSNLPSPAEGVLCVILVNTAISISIFKGIIRSILTIFGIRRLLSPQQSNSDESHETESDFHIAPPGGFVEEFRCQTPTIKFGSVFNSSRSDHDCSVCLTPFEAESDINRLSCGHVYHKTCLEKWLDYWNITCPLCRTPLLPEEEAACIW